MAEQSNITLRFDAEDGGAEAALLGMDKAERKLDASVKIGNKTLRERINTEGDLAKVLDKVRRGEEQAMTAGQRRAKASLAAQKSAALLAKMQADAAREQRMATGWETAAARAQDQADKRNHDRLMRRKAELAASMAAQRGAFARGFGGALSFSTSLLGIGTAAAAATAAIRVLTAAHEHQMDVARRGADTAKGLKEFIALQAPGPEGEAHINRTLARGAAMGLKPEMAAQLAQPIQSVVDANGDGRLSAEEQAKFDEDFAAGGQLFAAGVGIDDAQRVITAGRARKRGGKESADKLTAAADLSGAGPADFARSASAMGQFDDADTALAVVTALTAEEKNFEQIPTLVRGAALSLNSAADESELSKKFGLAGLSEAEKIAKLREIGAKKGKGATEDERVAQFSKTLKNYGLDEEKARALGILVRQSGTVESTRERLGTLDPGLAEAKVTALEESPLGSAIMNAEKAAALSSLDNLTGVEADGARKKREKAFQRGMELKRMGAGYAVDQETGEAKPWYSPSRIIGEFMGTQGGNRMVQSEGGGKDLQGSFDMLTKALAENTEATRANSTASAGNKPAGGAAANAEERY